MNGTLFFRANDGVNGDELWRSDGTSAGTTLVKDIVTGSGSSNPSYLANVNGTLFFRANDGVNGYELWQSDGTSAGTTLVKDIRSEPAVRIRFSDERERDAVLPRQDGTNGDELWKSDGTSAGTTLVKDIVSRKWRFVSVFSDERERDAVLQRQ
jgi:ELWxxDGT repeat protein